MCESPCATCTALNFYSCTSCLSNSQTLTTSLCITSPTMVYQIVGTCLSIMFIVPVLIRKRSLILVKILDLIQISSYFKFIVGYCPYRHVWLYLNMRGWGFWAEGWQIIASDPTVPIWTVQEGNFDKLIRIVSTWVIFLVVLLLVGIMKIALSQADLTFAKFMSMNIGNTLIYAYYFTLQDLSFFVAASLMNQNRFSTTNEVLCFSLAVFFSIMTILYIMDCFHRINFIRDQPSEKLYPYKYFFLFSAEYDLFPTYNLTQIPTSSKQIHKFSNLRVIDMLKKILYSFLIVYFLTLSVPFTHIDQIFQILAFIVFFELIWLVVFPFDLKREFSQLIVWMLAVGITLYLLFGPWYINNEIIHSVLAMSLFGLGLLSLVLEVCLNVYLLIPVDLYETGMKVVIEDSKLLQELAIRKKEQEEMEKKLKELQEEKKKIEQNKNNKSSIKQIEDIQRQESELSLSGNTLNNEKDNERPIPLIKPTSAQKQSMNSEQIAQLYKIDEIKRRKLYQWDKQKPFVYSNKIQ